MFSILGILVVFGAVAGGYFMSHGKFGVLFQPAELVVIFGAAIGSMLVANPLSIVRDLIKRILAVLKGTPYSKSMYLDTLKALADVFSYGRKNGLQKLENDIENPKQSQLFSQHKVFSTNHHALDFVCDTLRTAIAGGIGHFEIEQSMEADIDIMKHELEQPVSAMKEMADSLPGMGIVAAVLGVVITMGSLGGPPEQIGEHVAAALVGTFLGILFCYGIFGPLASNIQKMNEGEIEYMHSLRAGVAAFCKGAAPILAVEMARRSIPPHVRPSFKEMEQKVKGGGAK
ncbi:flagellar motor stator protein MotA [Bryobacter aggregatus]|uniref:flagellar motor stator protein MotA n=1 Tax=Bryobacter aggregatus TaxID=360054 RepID=UPI0004E270C2|nr:flagellar motor stator protein MotA [Bryobacter aggregatus]